MNVHDIGVKCKLDLLNKIKPLSVKQSCNKEFKVFNIGIQMELNIVFPRVYLKLKEKVI